jgi:hypothetical protein
MANERMRHINLLVVAARLLMPVGVGRFLYVLVIEPKDILSYSYDVGQLLCRLVVDQARVNGCPNQG